MNEFLVGFNQPIFKQIVALLPTDLPVYLVGGAIRDALLNRPSYDLDFVTSGNALKIARQIADQLGAAYYPLDSERKVARFIIKQEDEANKPGKTAIRVDFSTYQGPDLTSDLQKRDFTLNAMAIDAHDMRILIDPLGGAKDLLAKKLRPCSNSAFLDDPVRILRAARFAVNLELTIPSETLQLIRQGVDKIPEVSAERLRDELFRILVQPNPATAFRIIDKFNALEYVLPELCKLKGVEQSSPHIMNVWEHTLETLTRLETLLNILVEDFNPDKSGNLLLGLAALRLGRYRHQFKEHFSKALNPDRTHRGLLFFAALYHDVGKPATKMVDESGKIRFLEHELIGSQLTMKRGQAMRLSNPELERLQKIVKYHMRPSFLSHEKDFPSRRAIFRFYKDCGVAGIDICLLSLADVFATYGSTLPQERWTKQLDVVRSLLSAWWEDFPESILPAAIIDGDDLINELGLAPGPLIGQILGSLREAQAAGEVKTREDAMKLANEIFKQTKTDG